MGILPVTEPDRFGPARNPWDTSRTPGGSSGGSAARGGVRHGPDRPRERRRRLDPHPGVVLRARRPQAEPRTRVARAEFGEFAGGVAIEGVRQPQRRRHRADPRRDLGLRAGRPVLGARPVRAVRRGGRSRAGHAAHRLLRRFAQRRAGGRRLRRGRDARPRSCSSRSGTRSTRRRRFADEGYVENFIKIWTAGVAGRGAHLGRLRGRAARPSTSSSRSPAQMVEIADSISGADYLGALDYLRAHGTPAGRHRGATSTCCSPPRSPSRRCRSAALAPKEGEPAIQRLLNAAEWVPFTPVWNVTGQPAISLPLHQTPRPACRSACSSWGRPRARSCCCRCRRSSRKRGRGPSGGRSWRRHERPAMRSSSRPPRWRAPCATREVSPVELVQAHIDRAEAVNPDLNTSCCRASRRRSRRRARPSGRSRTDGEPGPLHGVPFTAKECIEVAGMPCCDASKIFEGNVSTQDAAVVAEPARRGRDPDRQDQHPRVRVPLRLEQPRLRRDASTRTTAPRSVGGSSGGEGAALATGMTPIGVGSDYGGSIRVPCHFNGVVGHQAGPLRWCPTPATSRRSSRSASSCWSQIGPMARYVEDLELLLPIFARPNLARARTSCRAASSPAIRGRPAPSRSSRTTGSCPVDAAFRARGADGRPRRWREDGPRGRRRSAHRSRPTSARCSTRSRWPRPPRCCGRSSATAVGELSPQIARVIGAAEEARPGPRPLPGRMVQIAGARARRVRVARAPPDRDLPDRPRSRRSRSAPRRSTIDGQEYEEIDLFSLSTYVQRDGAAGRGRAGRRGPTTACRSPSR